MPWDKEKSIAFWDWSASWIPNPILDLIYFFFFSILWTRDVFWHFPVNLEIAEAINTAESVSVTCDLWCINLGSLDEWLVRGRLFSWQRDFSGTGGLNFKLIDCECGGHSIFPVIFCMFLKNTTNSIFLHRRYRYFSQYFKVCLRRVTRMWLKVDARRIF